MKLLALGLLCVVGCGHDPCEGHGPSSEATAPKITAFNFVRQTPSDPWMLIFATGFADSDGDLGAGHAEVFLDGTAALGSVGLADLFEQSELDTHATSGTVGVPLRFNDQIRDGRQVSVQIQVSDAAAHRSNCYESRLKFSVQEGSP